MKVLTKRKKCCNFVLVFLHILFFTKTLGLVVLLLARKHSECFYRSHPTAWDHYPTTMDQYPTTVDHYPTAWDDFSLR